MSIFQPFLGKNLTIWPETGIFPPFMASIYTCVLDSVEAEKLRSLLAEGNFQPRSIAYADFAFARPGLSIAYYAKRGKLVVQGSATDEFLEFTLGPCVLGHDVRAREGEHEPAGCRACDRTPHFGVDESGKGDYFGPLVIAGVYTAGKVADLLAGMGVCDSKLIKNPATIDRLAAGIIKTPGVAFEVVCIGPERYNAMYADMGNLNRLLAWGHARVIASLHDKVPSCPRALSDQFANPWVLKKALGAREIPIRLEQKTKAESDVAVAAASILARARFVQWMREAGERAGCKLPLGAGPHVTRAARDFVSRHGEEMLGAVSKLHFKTTAQVLRR